MYRPLLLSDTAGLLNVIQWPDASLRLLLIISNLSHKKSLCNIYITEALWSLLRELNPWPHPYHGCALPTELRRRLLKCVCAQVWSGWGESNPHIQLGKLMFCHWTTPTYANEVLAPAERLLEVYLNYYFVSISLFRFLLIMILSKVLSISAMPSFEMCFIFIMLSSTSDPIIPSVILMELPCMATAAACTAA